MAAWTRTPIALLAGALVAFDVQPAWAFGAAAHEALARAALGNLPAPQRAQLTPYEAHLLRGVRDAVGAGHTHAGPRTEPADRLRAVERSARRLTVLRGEVTPFLAYALGRLAVEVAHVAQPYGLYRGAYAPAFAASYETILDETVWGGVSPRAVTAPSDDVHATLDTAWQRAVNRQAAVRTDAERGFPADCASVTSAPLVAVAAAEALAHVWGVLLQPSADFTHETQLIALSLEQVRFGAREQAWLDVERGLRRLAEAGVTLPLTPANVGEEFFALRERGADCGLYTLAVHIDAQGSRLRTLAAACPEPGAGAGTTEAAPAEPLGTLSSAEETGIRVFRHRRGHVLLTNRFRELGDEFVALNFTPIRRLRPASPSAAVDLETVVQHYAKEYGLDSALLKAVMETESSFDPHVVSRAGARGLMQLMPNTAMEMGVEDIFDPTENVAGGAQYLAKMLELFEGDPTLALAAYNAGPGTVMRYGGVPPYAETQRYVPLVLERRARYRRTGAAVALRGDTPRPAVAFLPEDATLASGALVFLRNGLTMRGLQAVEVENGVRIEMETGWILVPRRNVARVVRGTG